MSYQTTPDEPVDHDSHDGYRPHTCGRYVEEHRLAYKRQPDGTSHSYWECPL